MFISTDNSYPETLPFAFFFLHSNRVKFMFIRNKKEEKKITLFKYTTRFRHIHFDINICKYTVFTRIYLSLFVYCKPKTNQVHVVVVVLFRNTQMKKKKKIERVNE